MVYALKAVDDVVGLRNEIQSIYILIWIKGL